MVQEKMVLRILGAVALPARAPKDAVELSVMEYMSLADLGSHVARWAAEAFTNQNKDAEPRKIMATLPSNTIWGWCGTGRH